MVTGATASLRIVLLASTSSCFTDPDTFALDGLNKKTTPRIADKNDRDKIQVRSSTE